MAFAYFCYAFTTVVPQLITLANPNSSPDPGYVYGGSFPVVIFVFVLFNLFFLALHLVVHNGDGYGSRCHSARTAVEES